MAVNVDAVFGPESPAAGALPAAGGVPMTGHRHLPSEHYIRTLTGRQRPSATAMLVLDAVASICPHCRRTFELLAGERDRLPGALLALDRRPGEIGATAPGADPPALATPVRDVAEEVARLRRERRRWKLDLWELRRLPRPRRRARVEDARTRFSAAGLAELLAETAGELLTAEPEEAASLASLVGRVLARVPREETEAWALSLILRASARGADARRRTGDLAGAERVFRRLRAELAAHPDAAPDLVAEAAAREAYLLLDLGRPAEAEERLERAALLFREAGDRGGAAAVSSRRAILLLALERPEAALAIFDEVTARLEREDPPALWIGAVAGRIACLCAAGRGDEAERLLAAHPDVFENDGELLAGALYRGLEARVHAARGRRDRAAAALAACRAAHRTLGRSYGGVLAAIRRIVEEIPLPSPLAPGSPPRAPAEGDRPDPDAAERSAHLPLDACLGVCRGDLHPAALLQRAHEHLLEVCAGCRAEWGKARAAEPDGELFAGPPLHPPGLRALPSDPRRLLAEDVAGREALLSRLRLERRRAREDLGLLLSDPPWERPLRCEVARTRFASPALAELLVEAARAALSGDPAEAASLAELVPAVLGDVPGRETAWWQALAVRGEAELGRAEAALRLARGRTKEAEALLRRAVGAFRGVRDAVGERRALADLARLLRGRARSGEALRRLDRAAALLDAGAEPAARLEILLARARCLCDLGRCDEADPLLEAHRALLGEAGVAEAVTAACGLRGRIALGRGRKEIAAEAFEACRSGHLAGVRTFEALLATLDLARVHLPAARAGELDRLAAGAAPPPDGRAAAETLVAFALCHPTHSPSAGSDLDSKASHDRRESAR